VDLVGSSTSGLLALQVSVLSCELNGYGSHPAWDIYLFVTLYFRLNYSFFVGRLGLVGLGFSNLGLVLRSRVSFCIYSMDSKSFWIAVGRIAHRVLHLCSALSWATHLWSAQVWHVLTRDHSFTCHPHSYTNGMNHTFLSSPAAECHRTLAGTHFPPTEGRRLSWPEWLVTNWGGLPTRRRSLIPVVTVE